MLFSFDKRQNDSFYYSAHKFVACNSTIIKYPHKTELIYRHSASLVRQSGLDADGSSVNRSRKYHINANGVLVPNSDNILFSAFLKSQNSSRKRALDSSYRFALANQWSYFCTFTFDPRKVDRTNDGACKYCWQLFRQKVQYFFPNAKIYCVPEYHKSGSLHFHALIGNCDLSDYLEVATYPEGHSRSGQVITTQYGDTVYNFDIKLYQFGYTTVVPIRSNDDHEKIVNYLVKYVHKSKGLTYNQKSYYHTHNLIQAKKLSAFTSYEEFLSIILKKFNSDLNEFSEFKDNVIIKKITERYVIIDYMGIFDTNNSQKLCFANKFRRGKLLFSIKNLKVYDKDTINDSSFYLIYSYAKIMNCYFILIFILNTENQNPLLLSLNP